MEIYKNFYFNKILKIQVYWGTKMNFENLKMAKEHYDRVLETTKNLEKNGWIRSISDEFDISQFFELEIIKYMEYLIASDGRIDKAEVDVFRFITGFGGETLDSLKEDIENSNVMSYDFQSEPPIGFRLVVEGTNELLIQNPDEGTTVAQFLVGYLIAFYLIGECIIAADDTVTYNEKRDLKAYLRTLIQYVKEKSYVSENEYINKFERDFIENGD